jgi:electron transfer flavoprotein alpha subunit
MAPVLAVLEQRGGALKRISQEVLTAARALADGQAGEVHALLVGPSGVDPQGMGTYGADKVYVAVDDALALYQADAYAGIAAECAGRDRYAAVVVGATALGKDLGPRIAAKLACAYASDVTSVASQDGIVVTRPVYAGRATLTLKITQTPCVISIRPSTFTPVESTRAGTLEQVDAAAAAGTSKARTVEVKAPERAAVDVTEAAVVVSGGRGLKGPENFGLVEDLASALDGAVGASRAVVDAGWRPHSEQVGQTGKTVSPNLYVALGISGAVQHLAGMRTAKVIVAVNKDPDAPIFKVADYGIVGDVLEVVPKLTEEIKKIRES